jgi:hypothetical protein
MLATGTFTGESLLLQLASPLVGYEALFTWPLYELELGELAYRLPPWWWWSSLLKVDGGTQRRGVVWDIPPLLDPAGELRTSAWGLLKN